MTTTESGRPAFDPDAIGHDARANGLVVVAGAGLSMGPPASLPGWTAINDAFLEGLAVRLAEHTDGDCGYDVAEFVAARRETARVAQPDLQAQLAEDSLGDQYFKLFKPLDIETWNDGHAALAAIAYTGCLRAVVTTNFDRLIELAFKSAAIEANVYCASDDFDRLADGLASDRRTVSLIKVHGSVERPETMVDTLRQRVLGRPKALEDALVRLFAKHSVLIVGFSGADLAYDPRYLGLREGAARSPSFTVVNRVGDSPRPSLVDLVAQAGPQARLVDGVLPKCLVDLATALGGRSDFVSPRYDTEMEFPGLRQAGLPADVYFKWARHLSPVRAAVVLATIAEAAGSTDAAFQLLMRSMPYHLKAGLHADVALPSQLAMIAEKLIEACHVSSELSAEAFKGRTSALQVLSIAGVQDHDELLAARALALGLCGYAEQSEEAAARALSASRRTSKPIDRADTLRTLARTWTLTERWTADWVEEIREVYDLMIDWGDEPRRARVGVLLARFLIETGQLEPAARVLDECRRTIERLDLALTSNDLIATGGRLWLAAGQPQRALRALLSACTHYESSQQHLRLAEALLPLSEAAMATEKADVLKQSVDRFEALLPLVPGLGLPQAASKVRILCSVGALEDARAVVADLAALGEAWGGHPWIVDLTGRLERYITERPK